jgi:hypothetical protein
MKPVRKLAQGSVEVLPGREEQEGLPAALEERELGLVVGVERKREESEQGRVVFSSSADFRSIAPPPLHLLFSLSLSLPASSLTSSTNSAFTLLKSSMALILIPSKIERSRSTGLEEGERLSGEETEVIGKEALPFSIARLAESSSAAAAGDRAACSLLFGPIFGRRESNRRGEASGAEERSRLGVRETAPLHWKAE